VRRAKREGAAATRPNKAGGAFAAAMHTERLQGGAEGAPNGSEASEARRSGSDAPEQSGGRVCQRSDSHGGRMTGDNDAFCADYFRRIAGNFSIEKYHAKLALVGGVF